MAEENKPEEAQSSGGGSKLPMILALINTLAVMAALGAIIYTKVLYKRPAITEAAERQKIEKQQEANQGKDKLPSTLNLAVVPFDAINATIAPEKGAPGESARVRYANIQFSIEVREAKKTDQLEAVKTQFLDELLNLLGRKKFEDLTTVQGRYVLRSEMIAAANKLLKDDLVTNVYFNHYLIQ